MAKQVTQEIVTDTLNQLKTYIDERGNYLIDATNNPEWCSAESSRQAWEQFEMAIRRLLEDD